MTTKTSTEQFRADFEALERKRKGFGGDTLTRAAYEPNDEYLLPLVQARWEGYQAGRAALQSQDRGDAERYRYLITKLQQVYDGDYFETDLMNLYCHMPSQYKGERVVRAEITWRDKADEPIGLSEAIDHARRVEGEGE